MWDAQKKNKREKPATRHMAHGKCVDETIKETVGGKKHRKRI